MLNIPYKGAYVRILKGSGCPRIEETIFRLLNVGNCTGALFRVYR